MPTETGTPPRVADNSTPLVVDSSVAIRWLIYEDGSPAAEDLRGQDLHAPTFLRVEAGNVLRTLSSRGALTGSQAREAFDLLLEAPVTWHELDGEVMYGALEIGLALGHPIYDCLYLALAIDLGASLVTADRRFHRAVEARADLVGIVGLLGEM